MGRNTTFKSIGLALLTTSVLSTSAMAGGFDRGGVNIDQLFDEGRFGASAQVTYVNPQREINNVVRDTNLRAGVIIDSIDGNPGNGIPEPGTGGATLPVVGGILAANPPAQTANVDVDGDYVVPRFGAKVNVGQGFDCLASYSEPFGADASYGLNNAQSISAVEFEIDTQDYGLTCGYQFGAGTTSVGDAFARIIVGGSYQELDGFQSRQTFQDLGILGLGQFNVEGDSVGWRIGASYEIPDIALRALVIYNSKYDYDLSGTQDNRGFGAVVPGTEVVPITLQTEIPQSLEFKLQSGISEGTLAFANIKWQQWSKLDIIRIQGGRNPLTGAVSNLAFEPGYRDGYTLTAGIAKVLTEDLAARVSLTWDRGTATDSGTQTDSWTMAGGIRYSPNESIDLNIGGAVGLLTSGNSRRLDNSVDQSGGINYSFDNDIVYALSGGLKYKF